MCFKVKVLETFGISSDCHIKKHVGLLNGDLFGKSLVLFLEEAFLFLLAFNPTQDRRGQKESPTNFSRVTSTSIRVSPKNCVTFSFNPFATLV